MMQAEGGGIWLYAAIGIASLLYKAWKKNQADIPDSEPQENVEPSNSGFGFEDLIKQFEQKYKVQNVHNDKNPVANIIVENPTEYSKDNVNNQMQESDASESYNVKVEPQSVKADYSGSKDRNFETQVEEDLPELDLKQMIISNTILERPNY